MFSHCPFRSNLEVFLLVTKILRVPCVCQEDPHIRQESSPPILPGKPHVYVRILLRCLIGSMSHIPNLFNRRLHSHTLGLLTRALFLNSKFPTFSILPNLDNLRTSQIIKMLFPVCLAFFSQFLFLLSFYYEQQGENRVYLSYFAWKSPQQNIQVHHVQILLSTKQSKIQPSSLPRDKNNYLSSSFKYYGPCISEISPEIHLTFIFLPEVSSRQSEAFLSCFSKFFHYPSPNSKSTSTHVGICDSSSPLPRTKEKKSIISSSIETTNRYWKHSDSN